MIIDVIIGSYLDDILSQLVKKLSGKDPADGVNRTIDERIAMIDSARANLLEGVQAIDELRQQAEQNKKDVANAMQQIALLERDKNSLEEQRKAIAAMIDSDVTAFQRIAGIPSKTAIRRERFIGFISGVIASTVASGVVWMIVKIIESVSAG